MRPGLQGQDGETLRIPGQVRRDRLRGHARSNNSNGLETWAGLSRHQNQTRLRSRTSRALGSTRAYAPETRIRGATKGKNLFFATSAQSREAGIRSIAGDIRKLEKQGYSEESITKMTLSIVAGLTGFLFNCPLDMTIERYIRKTFPSLLPAQFLALRG